MIFLKIEEKIFDKLNKIENNLASLLRSYLFVNSKIIEEKLNELFEKEHQRKIWIFINGDRSQREIAKLANVSRTAVSNLIQYGTENGLIDNSSGTARKIIDFNPKDWLLMIPEK